MASRIQVKSPNFEFCLLYFEKKKEFGLFVWILEEKSESLNNRTYLAHLKTSLFSFYPKVS